MNNHDFLPAYMRDDARLYVEEGIEPGGFMMAVLTNDFKEAVGRADQTNRQYLLEWAQWVHNEVPMMAQGSEEKVLAWIKAGGFKGIGVKLQQTQEDL